MLEAGLDIVCVHDDVLVGIRDSEVVHSFVQPQENIAVEAVQLCSEMSGRHHVDRGGKGSEPLRCIEDEPWVLQG